VLLLDNSNLHLASFMEIIAMAKRNDFTDTLLDSPWWVSAVAGLATWGLAALVLALTSTSTGFGQLLHALAPLHWIIPIFFGLTAAAATLVTWHKRRLLTRNRSLDRIRSLTWEQFETLTGQYFREQGYRVSEQGGRGPDDGVDLLLRRGEETVFVQCKHWKAWCVGLPKVKELFATVRDRGATGGILLTISHFSRPARAFASRHPELRLVNGIDLEKMLGPEVPAPTAASNDCTCPKCGAEMETKVARRGRSAGNSFLSCTRFPACKGSRDLPAAS
jgi:restriction system protein